MSTKGELFNLDQTLAVAIASGEQWLRAMREARHAIARVKAVVEGTPAPVEAPELIGGQMTRGGTENAS